MSTLEVRTAGPQAILVAGPRTGHRHLGVPGAGAADPLSLGLLNAALGNPPDHGGIECPYGGFEVAFTEDRLFAVGGAPAPAALDGEEVPAFVPFLARAGAVLTIGPAAEGMRVYLGVAGGILGDEVLGSASTYLPAGLGGHEGRALRAGDALALGKPVGGPRGPVPEELHPFFERGWVLRALPGPDLRQLGEGDRARLWTERRRVGRRADRMGMAVEDAPLDTSGLTDTVSGPVFCGTLQAPPEGPLFLLGPDAQTTGGYPRLLQVIRADRHRIGQLRPGDGVHFRRTDPEAARRILAEKQIALSRFAPDLVLPG